MGGWKEWGSCSVSCGNGYQSRRRRCEELETGKELSVSQCYGREEEYQACPYKQCPVWDKWSDWSECSTFTTCGRGFRLRTRQCAHGGTPGVDRYCLGPLNETTVCHGIKCDSMLRLVNVSEFGEGRVEMYHDQSKKWLQICADKWDIPMANVACKQRGFRLGAFQAVTNGQYGEDSDLDTVELSCQGHEWTLQQCHREKRENCVNKAAVQCKVKGIWSLWSGWSECSVTCEDGIQTRTRKCNHPPPNFGGLQCPGSNTEQKNCTKRMCPIDGAWEPWTLWSSCSVSCANGTQTRTRTCSGPQHDGKDCIGDYIEVKDCFPKMCPVDGVWQSWSKWTECSATCGYGIRTRNRTCDGPFYDGVPCQGDDSETEVCNAFSCPVDGSWKPWSPWGECDVVCGGGIQGRWRECDDPLHGGADCPGPANQTQACNTHNCPVDGVWIEWTLWTDCSVTCANGTRYRNRTCVEPKYGGKECEGEPLEQEICVTLSCPVDGEWLPWSEWDACNVTCGGGGKRRYRTCIEPQFGGKDCDGPSDELMDCNMQPCPVDGDWTSWLSWSTCTLTCGTGTQYRNRTCEGTAHGGKECDGEGDQVQDCNTDPCPVDGSWKLWSDWTQCNATCGGGYTWRTRECNLPAHGGMECVGPSQEIQDCNTQNCPVDGIWGEWSLWSECNQTCGSGTKTRERSCIGPWDGGKECVGDTQEIELCNTQSCAIDGQWEEWSNWTECSQSCGRGTQVRTRQCDGPYFGGEDCKGEATESKLCNPSNCPVDGVWLDWSTWGECDVTCGGGNQVRNRSCEGPYYEGKECEGDDMETRDCNTQNCPVDGEWLPWMKWEPCSVSCGGGNQSRIRYCNGPYYGGEDCVGSDVDTQECNTHPCPVDGVLEAWSAWMECDVTCGGGIQWRNRSCIEPLHGGKACEGEREESQACNTHNCPVDGEWKLWSAWSQCNVTCGGGGRYRQRSCEEPLYGGADCEGPAEEEEECNIHPCPVDGVWETWTAWGSCDLSCGGGIQWRERTCDGPYHGGANCSGPGKESQDCNTHPCPEDGVFMAWSEWGSCDVTCGGGSQLRNRTCHGPFHGGKNCEGATEESQVCNSNYCPVDGVWQIWSSWDECSATCGGGVSVRNRTCHGPFYGGSECEGNDTETKSCSQNACPIPGDWLDWEGWSRCSKTCGGGTRYRLRQCDDDSYGDLTAPCEGSDTDTEDCHTYPCEPYAQTCSELVQWGLLDSANVTLKPKPSNPIMPELSPCEVYCDLEMENGVGVTIIGHDQEARTFVSGYEGTGDYKATITYDISYDHVVAIVDHSAKCKQYLRWECYAATIKNPHLSDVWSTYWTKRGDVPADYFPGGVPGSGKCGCGQIGNCANASAACNCDINDQVWRSDEGYLTYKDDLPIYSFRAGDTGDENNEMGYYTVGKVFCSGTV